MSGLNVAVPLILDAQSLFPHWNWQYHALIGFVIFLIFMSWIILDQKRAITKLLDKQKVRVDIDRFISEGNRILSILPPTVEKLGDTRQYGSEVDKWATNVRVFLRPIGYEGRFCSNIEEDFGDESKPIEWSLTVLKKSLRQRIRRLQEIHKEL